MQMKYGDHEIDTANLPQISLDAMFRRGISHYLGNEAAAKVTAWAEKQAKDNAGVEPTDEAKAAAKADFQVAMLAALVSGEVGTSVRGPRVDPLEGAILRITTKEVTDILRAAGIKPPKKDEAVTFPGGVVKTMTQMIASRREREGDRITKEAQKWVAEQERKVKKAKETVAAVADKSADALGL